MQLTLFDDADLTPAIEPIDFSLPGTIRPRDYQHAFMSAFVESANAGARGALCRCFTGGGKTISAAMASSWWLNRGSNFRVFVVSHERDLVYQLQQEFTDVLGFTPELEMGDEKASHGDLTAPITIATRQTILPRDIAIEGGGERTISSRMLKFDAKRFQWLVIFDEAHKYAPGQKSTDHIVGWIDSGEGNMMLGLSATPYRTDRKRIRPLFTNLVLDMPLYSLRSERNAVAEGWAVPYDQRFVTVEGVDFKNIPEVAGDFDPEELARILSEHEVMLSYLVPMLELVKERRTLIFNPPLGMHKLVAMTINAMIENWTYDFPKPGRAAFLDGQVPHDVRQQVYREHQAGEYQFLSVCGLCREGYNDVNLGAVAVFRPTKSLSLSEQMKGRVCRPMRGLVDVFGLDAAGRRAAITASDKPTGMIIDMVGVSGLAETATTARVLASDESDAVIDRANELAMQQKEGPVDIGECVAEAKKMLTEEEREEKRRLKLEADEREQDEINKRSKLRGDVKYTEQAVEAGYAGKVAKKKRGARMIAGSFRGSLIVDLPDWYLRSLVEGRVMSGLINRTPWLKGSIRAEANKRVSCQDLVGGGSSQSRQRPKATDKNATSDDINSMLSEDGW